MNMTYAASSLPPVGSVTHHAAHLDGPGNLLGQASKSRRRRGRNAFTILELLIVIGILLAIGGLVLFNVLGASERADRQMTSARIKDFDRALESFRFDMKRWPSEQEGLAVLWSRERLENEEDERLWQGPYLKEPNPRDVWGTEWIYRQPSQLRDGRPYDIISAGPDRQEGTEDDITNHDGRVDDEDDFGDFSTGG